MNKKDLENYRIKLQKELTQLEEGLSTISTIDPDSSNGRDAITTDIEVDSADENEVADKMEELEENQMIVNKLSPQLNSVKSALNRIKNGKYGLCEKCGEKIEKERLDANPSSITCIKHMK